MKRYIIILAAVMIAMTDVMAQSSMSDSQIIAFVQKEQKAGTSQAQIVTKLMQKGVSVTKLQQLRKQYSNGNMNSMGGVSNSNGRSSGEITGNTSRKRISNGTSTRAGSKYAESNADLTKKWNKSTLGATEYNALSPDQNTVDGKKTMDFTEGTAMMDELNAFMPDSLNMMKKMEQEEKEPKRKVFGRDIFNNKNLSFEPNMNIATPQNYILGPGDAVYVDIYGASQKSLETSVSPDGYINIDGFGPVQVSGLTVSQANARLRSTLGARYSSSKVKLTVGQTKTIMINVMGEVKAPGTYTLSAFATVFHALYMAGGTSEIGTLRNIKVYRRGRLISNVDIYDYILNGKLSGNVRLADNDVIVVGPYDCLVDLTGKVKRPMWYEMKKTESVQTLLKYAGGFTGDAYTKSVRLNRKNGKEFSVYNVMEFDMSSFRVSDGDSVSVDSILPRYSNMVELKGAVFRPGMYQFGGEITTVKSLLEAADGMREDAFTQHAVMHRRKSDRTLEALSLDIQGIMAGTVADVPLQNEDVVFIPSTKELQDERKVKIYGEVFYPGTYQYADGMTVEDFILQAGGLKQTASIMKVSVGRRIIDPKATTTGKVRAESYEMSLQDGFIIDGQAGFKLQPFDEVYVRKSPGYSEQANVEVDGEVLFRGIYTLPKRNTRLSDVIKMAGGPTSEAYTRGARLERKMTDEEKTRAEQIMKMQLNQQSYTANGTTATSAASAEATMKLDSIEVARKLDISDTYYVGIELDKAMKNPGCDEDIVLRDGDKITLPQYDGTVTITGEVMYPNTVPYNNKHQSANYYIAQAGGKGNYGKKHKAYIIYQNGMVGKISEGAKVEPGCEIVVPRKKYNPNSMQNASMWVSMGSTLATMSAVVYNAIK